jgi:hypothetical protein
VTIAVLTAGKERLSIDELAEQVAERMSAETTADWVALRLHHVILPLLADASVIDYERAKGTVIVSEPVSGLLT